MPLRTGPFRRALLGERERTFFGIGTPAHAGHGWVFIKQRLGKRSVESTHRSLLCGLDRQGRALHDLVDQRIHRIIELGSGGNLVDDAVP